MAEVGFKTEDAPDKAVLLSLIDKYYSTLTRVWDSLNRLLFMELVLSLILFALSSGIVSVEESIELSGFKLKLSLTVILSGGALLIAAIYTSLFSQMLHADNLRHEIEELYKSIGYPLIMKFSKIGPFEIPNIYMTLIALVGRKRNTNLLIAGFDTIISLIAIVGVLFGIPIGAQIAAALKVASLFEWRWWVLVPFIALIILTISSLIVRFVSRDASSD